MRDDRFLSLSRNFGDGGTVRAKSAAGHLDEGVPIGFISGFRSETHERYRSSKAASGGPRP